MNVYVVVIVISVVVAIAAVVAAFVVQAKHIRRSQAHGANPGPGKPGKSGEAPGGSDSGPFEPRGRIYPHDGTDPPQDTASPQTRWQPLYFICLAFALLGIAVVFFVINDRNGPAISAPVTLMLAPIEPASAGGTAPPAVACRFALSTVSPDGGPGSDVVVDATIRCPESVTAFPAVAVHVASHAASVPEPLGDTVSTGTGAADWTFVVHLPENEKGDGTRALGKPPDTVVVYAKADAPHAPSPYLVLKNDAPASFKSIADWFASILGAATTLGSGIVAFIGFLKSGKGAEA
jgi:hypothetical protein